MKSITEVQTEILWQMLSMSEYKDHDSQKMIKDELRFRKYANGKTERELINDFTKAWSGK